MTAMINRFAFLTALFLASTAGAGTVQEAINHPGRPNSDREDDDRRHPVEIMTFAGVATGDVVLEIGAGRGYTTELTSRMVGESGKVIAHRISPDRLIGNRLPNVVAVPDEPEPPCVPGRPGWPGPPGTPPEPPAPPEQEPA